MVTLGYTAHTRCCTWGLAIVVSDDSSYHIKSDLHTSVSQSVLGVQWCSYVAVRSVGWRPFLPNHHTGSPFTRRPIQQVLAVVFPLVFFNSRGDSEMFARWACTGSQLIAILPRSHLHVFASLSLSLDAFWEAWGWIFERSAEMRL